jgi:vancomycin resistance protein VanW
MNVLHIEQPKYRSVLRKKLGKFYFQSKRKIKWIFLAKQFAKVSKNTNFQHLVIQHQSILLRQLKDVDMYLQHNKITNLLLAAEKINGVVIRPGEIFSIWKLVGKPTQRKGFLEGMTLESGKISTGIGGGLCQLGNLIYWMALHSPLTINERWRHGYDVFPDVNRTIPFACGATLSYNYIDLQLKNETKQSFQIKIRLDESFLFGEILCEKALEESFEIFETDHRFEHQFWGGYTRHNKIWKRITNHKTFESKEELVTENNAIMMYNPLLKN